MTSRRKTPKGQVLELGPVQKLAGIKNDPPKMAEITGSMLISLDDIDFSISQVRKGAGLSKQSISRMADSIESHGIIQPIIVQQKAGVKKFQLIAGERRARGVMMCRERYQGGEDHGLDQYHKIPAICREAVDPLTLAELMIIENGQREDLDPVDEALAIADVKKGLDSKGIQISNAELASRLGKAKSTVTEALVTAKMLELQLADKSEKDTARKNLNKTFQGIPKKLLYEVAKTIDTPYHHLVLKEVQKPNITQRKLQEFVKKHQNADPIQEPTEIVLRSQHQTAKALINTIFRIDTSSLSEEEKQDLVYEVEQKYLTEIQKHLSSNYFRNFDIKLSIVEKKRKKGQPGFEQEALQEEEINKINKKDKYIYNLNNDFNKLESRTLDAFETYVLRTVNKSLNRFKNNSINPRVLGRALKNGLSIEQFVDEYNLLVNRQWPGDNPGKALYTAIAGLVLDQYQPATPGFLNQKAFKEPEYLGQERLRLLYEINLEEERKHFEANSDFEEFLKTFPFKKKSAKGSSWEAFLELLKDSHADKTVLDVLATVRYCGEHEGRPVLVFKEGRDIDVFHMGLEDVEEMPEFNPILVLQGDLPQ